MWDLRSLLPLSFFPLGCPVHSCVHALHSVCLCLCQYVFSRIVGKCMHACAECFNFQSYAFSLTCLFSERATVKSCIEHQTQQLMFSAGYSISHQGSGLGVYFMAFPVQSSETGNEKAAKDSLIISKAKQRILQRPQDRVAVLGWPYVCVHARTRVCALGVVLLNMANSDAHADGSTEMVSVSKVPLAVWGRKDVSAANAFEHSRFQINFPCCLLGRRRWGLGQAHGCWKIQSQLANFLHSLLC